MGSKAEVFRLEAYSFEPSKRSQVADLAPITPRFSLPPLEDGNTSDRLLAGLRGGWAVKPRTRSHSSLKGKEREEIEEDVLPEDVTTQDEGDFWLNVAQSEAGPSKPRLNKASPPSEETRR
jgi:hypothetical protein